MRFQVGQPHAKCRSVYSIDLVSPATCLQIADWSAGSFDMRYRRVACTPPGNIKVDVDANSCANGWLRLHIEVR